MATDMPDALIAAQGGFHAVGLLGAQTPDETVAARLANHASNIDAHVVLVCDPDAAGRRVAEALAPLLEAQGHIPTVITPPDNFDLNDWATADRSWADRIARPSGISPPVAHEFPTAISADVEF